MENKNKRVGIRIKNSSDVRIENSIFEGLDTAIDAENLRDLKLKGNKISNGVTEDSVSVTLARRHFVIGVVAITIGILTLAVEIIGIVPIIGAWF